jgi:hypothetical protein
LSKQFKKVNIAFFTETVQKGSKLFFKPEKAQKSSKSPFSGSKKLNEAQRSSKISEPLWLKIEV